MNLLQQLSVLAVYQFLGDRAESFMAFVENRFKDHAARLESALRTANERAWRTLEVALAALPGGRPARACSSTPTKNTCSSR